MWVEISTGIDLSHYISVEQLNEAIKDFLTSDQINEKLSEMATIIENKIPTKVSELTNDEDFATTTYVNRYGGKIDKISLNGEELEIVDKQVDIILPESKAIESIVIEGQGNAITTCEHDKSGKTLLFKKETEFLTEHQSLDAYALKSTSVGSVNASIDSTNYKITIETKDVDGNPIGEPSTLDLPIESVVVSGAYNEETKEVELTLQNNSVVKFSVADLVAGLQNEINAENKLNADYVDDTNSANKFVTNDQKTTWTNKQDAITQSNKLASDLIDTTDQLNQFFPSSASSKLDGIENGAQVNVQANWSETVLTSDAYIKNKPTALPNPHALTIKQNGEELVSYLGVTDGDVDIIVPTKLSELDNDTKFATEDFVTTNGGKIDSISVNNVAQDILNKNVNIKVPVNTSEINNNSGYITKEVSDLTNYTNTTDLTQALNKKLDSVKVNVPVLTGSTLELSGTEATLTNATLNLSTGSVSTSTSSIGAATTTSAGLMSAATFGEIGLLKTKVGALEGKTTRLLYNAKTNPTAEEINTFVSGLGYTTPYEGIAVVIDETYHIWHYYENDSAWKDDGLDTVNIFTNSTLGVIQGSTEDGYVSATLDGKGVVNGFSQVKQNVENLTSEVEEISNSMVSKAATVNGKNFETGAISLGASDVGAEPTISKKTAFNVDFESSSANMKANGTASVGTTSTVARADHIHPMSTAETFAQTESNLVSTKGAIVHNTDLTSALTNYVTKDTIATSTTYGLVKVAYDESTGELKIYT